MSDKKTADKGQAKSWFQGLKAEYKKIIWTSREELAKQTVTVISITAILCVLISVMDAGILQCINFLMK
ncbi:MAG: preprotein translocase subunit SecE [Blautia sp.]|nr:preprotein translocase subunit SecE [Blautia sp.]